MLVVNIDPTGSYMWGTFYRFNGAGQVIWKAHPSAVALPASLSTLEVFSDLLNYNSASSQYQYLNNASGLIEITNYYSSTSPGAVQASVSSRQVQQGQAGTPITVSAYTYTSNTDAGGNTVYPIASQISYPVAGSTATSITTVYAYAWYSGTNVMQQRTTTLPVIGSGQNGNGTAYSIVEQYDSVGNLTQRTDERGIVSTYAYSLLGELTEQVLNVQSGVTQPGVNVTTDYVYDNQGRLTQTIGPSHTVVIGGVATTVRQATWNVYVQSIQPGGGAWAPDQNRVGTGYATGTSPTYTYTLVNPVTLLNLDKDGRTLDQIASRRTTGSGALSANDTFAQTDWQTWTNTQYDSQHRITGQSVYFLIPSSGTGTVGTNFGQTTYGYDALERRNRVVAPGGTITRTAWTTPQWVASVWVGTNDTGATDSNPAGSGSPNNMVIVTANVYDNDSAGGDGNLTLQAQFISAAPSDARAATFGYDFRDRQTSMTDATGRYTLYTYDNLDRQTQVQSYATLGGTLYSQSQNKYDDRGRVYQTLTYAVDPPTGTVGNALTSNAWYDPSGNLLQQIAQGDGAAFSKNAYNGVGWVTSSYRGYNTTGTSYAQATTVANDIILEQTDNTYDEVGNLVSMTSSQRLNDASMSTTGALTSSIARVSYMASWFDGIDRSIASANYGAISSFTRPSTPPASSATLLVTQTSYDDAGRVYQVTDPVGYVTQNTYDNASRTTQVVEANGTSSARTTNWTYTLDNLVATMTAVNSTTGNQTTTWTYGTSASSSGVVRNDLLSNVAYPDSVGGSDVVAYAYNRIGQQRTITDQRGTVRTFYYDLLGRLTNDCVTTNGTGTDVATKQIIRAYEIRGMVSTIKSTDSATQGSGTVLSQVAFAYNNFGQLSTDQQSHSGAVGGSTPSVQYGYDTGASSSNEIRLNALTYPNARVVSYNYASGIDATLNRITSISDSSATLASYAYLGAGTAVRITYPQPSVWLDLWGGTSGTFNGLDQFNRVIDQRWQNQVTTTPTDIDRYQYGYDRDSNRLYKANVVGTAAVSSGLDEYYTYDPLNRLTEMQRGVLNSARTGITGTPSAEQDWTLDPTGNWSGFVTKASGTTTLNQSRTANPVNEITNITESTGPTWVVPAYDPAGNTTTMPQVTDPSQSFTATYDAWNRMVSISSSSGLVGKYQYDGRNFRIVKQTYTGGSLSETRHFYFTAGWQDIEERVGSATTMDKQYVWGARYIDELVCRDDATPQRLYATQDANFNLTSIADASGSVPERYLFDPYGNRTILNAAWSIVSSSSYIWCVGHQGLATDSESGLIDNRNRIRAPQVGRFGQHDAGEYDDGANLYEFALSDPIDFVDSDGNMAHRQGGSKSSSDQHQSGTRTDKMGKRGGEKGDKRRDYRRAGGRKQGRRKGTADSDLISTIALCGCELVCAVGYNNCIQNAGDDLDSCLHGCSVGHLSPSDEDTCINACLDIHKYTAYECATNYAICGLACLLPFSPPRGPDEDTEE